MRPAAEADFMPHRYDRDPVVIAIFIGCLVFVAVGLLWRAAVTPWLWVRKTPLFPAV